MADTYAKLRAAIARPSRSNPWSPELLGKPSLKFILARDFDRYSRLLAYDFVTELHEASGIEILDVHVSDGCIDVALRLKSHLDFKGRDLRTQIVGSSEYHSIFSRFDVKAIYLHCFPDASNFDNHLILGPAGRPYRPD